MTNVSDKIWHSVSAPMGTFIGLFNSELSYLDGKYEGFLPDIRSSSTLLLGSDYSGESSDSPYSVYSFVMTTLDSWKKWESSRIEIRRTHLTEFRRMSFKRLNDGQRRRALMPFLQAANDLNGLSFSIAVNKECKSFFEKTPPLNLSNPEFARYRKWKPAVLEKAFFIVHVLGTLLGGLAACGQDVFWFSDEDSIAANDERISELTSLFAWISSSYLDFDLGNLRCGTSRSDNGTLQLEDFLAIPDLVAGAIAEQMRTPFLNPSSTGNFWMSRGDFSNKTRNITWWLSDASQSLKRLLCIIEPAPKGHSISWVHFHNRDDERA